MLAFTGLGALNFNNNLALLLVFTLVAVAQSTSLLAYRNLAGLRIDELRAEPVFAGEPSKVDLFISNPERRERFSLQLAQAGEVSESAIDLNAECRGKLTTTLVSKERGWLEIPPQRLETRYPLGLFRSWTWIFPKTRCLVYPKPATHPPPLPTSGRGRRGKARVGEGDQVHGLRNYQPGDSLRRVAWRTSARHEHLFTREMEAPQEQDCSLDWDLLKGIDTEQRLSILTAWVMLADHRHMTYSLALPNAATLKGNDAEHRSRCLESLALYGL